MDGSSSKMTQHKEQKEKTPHISTRKQKSPRSCDTHIPLIFFKNPYSDGSK